MRLRVPAAGYYLLGEKVDVQQVDASVWLPATVADTHDDMRYYTVLYDRGVGGGGGKGGGGVAAGGAALDRQDILIPPSRLRRRKADALATAGGAAVDDGSGAVVGSLLSVGDQVEANFNSEGNWYARTREHTLSPRAHTRVHTHTRSAFAPFAPHLAVSLPLPPSLFLSLPLSLSFSLSLFVCLSLCVPLPLPLRPSPSPSPSRCLFIIELLDRIVVRQPCQAQLAHDMLVQCAEPSTTKTRRALTG